MTSLEDDEELSPEVKQRLNDDLLDHLKRSGEFDSIRVSLLDAILNDPCFTGDIVDRFVNECKMFCEQVDLSQNRNTLRAKLAEKFEKSYSTSSRLVRSHILNILAQKNDEIERRFNHHAELFLRKFLPTNQKSPEPSIVIDDQSKPVEHNKKDVKPQLTDAPKFPEVPDMPDLSELPEVLDLPEVPDLPEMPDSIGLPEKPDWPTVPMPAEIKVKEEPQVPELPPLPKEPPNLPDEHRISESIAIPQIPVPLEEKPESVKTQADTDMEIDSDDGDDIPPPLYSPVGVKDEDPMDGIDDCRLTFSSVSSVDTADLSDFDNYDIKLSDDEANIVGKPKNSKVPIDVIQDQIKELESKTNEPCDTGESDGGGSEMASAEGRRISRARRSNPKYNNENFVA